MFRSDDPLADFAAYAYQQEKELAKRPRCSICGERIQDEYAFCVEGEWYHEDCYRDEYFRVVV